MLNDKEAKVFEKLLNKVDDAAKNLANIHDFMIQNCMFKDVDIVSSFDLVNDGMSMVLKARQQLAWDYSRNINRKQNGAIGFQNGNGNGNNSGKK